MRFCKLKKEVLVIIVIILLFSKLSFAQVQKFDPDSFDYNSGDYAHLSASQVQQLDAKQIPPEHMPEVISKLSESQKQQLSGNQLAAVPDTSLGDLGQYNRQALTEALQQKGYDIQELTGTLSGAQLSGNTLILADGSTFDLHSGKKITIAASAAGVEEFSDGAGLYMNGAQDVDYKADHVSASSVQNLQFNGAKAQNVQKVGRETKLDHLEGANPNKR